MSGVPVVKKADKRGSNSGINSPSTPNAASRIPGATNKKVTDKKPSHEEKLSVSVAPDEPELAIHTKHRDLSKCPCNNSNNQTWQIDCSKCKQYWHVDCLSLNGLTGVVINKLVEFKCPFCWVSPIPTFKSDHSVCYICRNTLSLQQSNNVLETMLSTEKLNSLQNLATAMSSIDFEKFTAQVGTIQNFDLHLQHLLLNQNSLEGYQDSVKEIESRMNGMSLSMETTMSEISGQISSLQTQVDELSSTQAYNPTAETDNSGELLASIAAKLDELYSQEPVVRRQLSNLQATVDSTSLATHDHHDEYSPAIESIPTPNHGEEAISHSVDEFIDHDLETSLLDLFESNLTLFNAENGHSVISYGEKYRYVGSNSSTESTSSPMPSAIRQLIDKVNETFCSDDRPEMNSCLVNRYDGSSSYLPQHSDDEAVIHPESSIFTLSLGQECPVTFTESKTGITKDHSCKSRSLYAMTRKSQLFFKHHIEVGSVSSGVRYSLTFRSVSWRNRNATCIIGDSNTGSLKFGSDRARTFGDLLPGKQIFAPVIDKINPYDASSYNNVVIMCGINDIKVDGVKNKDDLRNIYNKLKSKIEQIQTINSKSHIYICPVLPTKIAELNRKVVCFNSLIFSELLPSNFGVTCVNGFDGFLDENGLLSKNLSRHLNKFKKLDTLHLSWKGVATLARLIKSTVLLRMNGGIDRRKRHQTSRVDGRPYSEVTTSAAERQDGYQST